MKRSCERLSRLRRQDAKLSVRTITYLTRCRMPSTLWVLQACPKLGASALRTPCASEPCSAKGLASHPLATEMEKTACSKSLKWRHRPSGVIYDKYINEGLGLRLIAQYLNEHNIKTRRGGRWNMVTIRDILRNPTYTGTYYRFGLRLPKVHEAIISPQLFRRAQDQTKARRPSSRSVNTEPFLLSGLAFCGYCGNKMMGVTRRQSWRRKDGNSAQGVYRYYQCQSRNNQSLCGYHTWRAPVLESTVLSQLHDNRSMTAEVIRPFPTGRTAAS